MPQQISEHLFSLLVPHLSPSSLALTAASSATLYHPSILALYATLDLSRGVPLPSTILSPDAPCAPHLPHVRTIKLPRVMRYNAAMWAGGLGRMKGLRRVVVGHEWDAWPVTKLGVVGRGMGFGLGSRDGAGGGTGDGNGYASRQTGAEGPYGVSSETRLGRGAKVGIFGLKASRNGKSHNERDEREIRSVRRRLELEIQGACSPLSALPPGMDKTDILENTESITMRLERGLPVLREHAQAAGDEAGDEEAQKHDGGDGAVKVGLLGVDERRGVISALRNHSNIRHLKIILPVQMYSRQPRALAEPPIHYRHPAISSPSNTFDASGSAMDRAEEQTVGGWHHLDLQYDLVHLVRHIPVRCKLDFIVLDECAGEAWVGQLREAVDEQLGEQRLGSLRWDVRGGPTDRQGSWAKL